MHEQQQHHQQQEVQQMLITHSTFPTATKTTVTEPTKSS